MHDHGGNATPVWFVIARILFYFTHANNTVLILGALLDPLLLGLMFYAIKRTFGWRTMLVAITLFGANDFHMFGSNWVGATLRHDWMAYIGLGVCALAVKRWTLGGVLLAMASLIRAFPAFTLITFTFPAMGWAYAFYQDQKRLPKWAEIRAAQEPVREGCQVSDDYRRVRAGRLLTHARDAMLAPVVAQGQLARARRSHQP